MTSVSWTKSRYGTWKQTLTMIRRMWKRGLETEVVWGEWEPVKKA